MDIATASFAVPTNVKGPHAPTPHRPVVMHYRA